MNIISVAITELKLPEATYVYDDSGAFGHFGIDCACGGKDGKYIGSHYKVVSETLEIFTKMYRSIKDEFEHTFYISDYFFRENLSEEHSKGNGQSPVVIVCNDCGREFSFTAESYCDFMNAWFFPPLPQETNEHR